MMRTIFLNFIINKRKFFSIFLLLFFISFIIRGQSKYISVNHYSFDIPKTWGIIPSKLLDNQLRKKDLSNYLYEVGIQSTKSNNLNAIKSPYILVQFHTTAVDMDTIPFAKIIVQTIYTLKQEILNYNSPEIDSNKVKLIRFSVPVTDSVNTVISQELIIKVNNKDTVKYIKKIFFGRFGVVNLNCYILNEKFFYEKRNLDCLLKSFTFNKQYKLTENKRDLNTIKKFNWLKLIIPLIISFIVFFVIKYLDKNQRLDS